MVTIDKNGNEVKVAIFINDDGSAYFLGLTDNGQNVLFRRNIPKDINCTREMYVHKYMYEQDLHIMH